MGAKMTDRQCCGACFHFHPWPSELHAHARCPADGVCTVLRVALPVEQVAGGQCRTFRAWEPNHDAQASAVYGDTVLRSQDDEYHPIDLLEDE